MLLERFRRGKHRTSEIEAMVANLNQVLNTKKGFGYWLPGFGIGDYNEYRGRSRIVQTLIDEIKENIQRFEPRVHVDAISEVDAESPFRLRFEVSGVFVNESKPFNIVVDSLRHDVTIEEPDGRSRG